MAQNVVNPTSAVIQNINGKDRVIKSYQLEANTLYHYENGDPLTDTWDLSSSVKTAGPIPYTSYEDVLNGQNTRLVKITP